MDSNTKEVLLALVAIVQPVVALVIYYLVKCINNRNKLK